MFRWQADQGESSHDGEQDHRPTNDHTMWVPEKYLLFMHLTQILADWENTFFQGRISGTANVRMQWWIFY